MTRFFSDLSLTPNGDGQPSSRSQPARMTLRRHRRGRLHRLAPRGGARSRPGHDVVGVDCFTDYYDPALKEENARGARRRAALDLAEDELDLDGVDGVFHLAGQPGVRELRRRLPALRAPERARDAARLRGGRARPACASSSRRRRRSTATPSAYPTPEDTTPRPLSPYGITKLGCEHLADAYARGFGLDVVVLRYFTRLRPAPAARHGVHADRRRARRRRRRSSSTATATSRAASPTSATSSTRRSPRWSGRTRRRLQRRRRHEATMRESIALSSRSPAGRSTSPAPRRGGRPEAHERRHDPDSARSSAGAPHVGSRTVLAGPVGVGLS